MKNNNRFGLDRDPGYVVDAHPGNVFKEEDNAYGFFGVPASIPLPTLSTQHSSRELTEMQVGVLEQMAEGYHQQKLLKKRAFFKWLVLAKSRQSLVVLERVLMASKPTVMKSLWMLKTEWVRRGSYRYQKGVKLLIRTFERLKRRQMNTGLKGIGHMIALKNTLHRMFVRLQAATENKRAGAFEKMLKYKRNWQAIKKMDVLFLLRDKTNEKKKLAFRELFGQTRFFAPLNLIMTTHDGMARAQFRNARVFFRRAREMQARTRAVKRLGERVEGMRKERLGGAMGQMGVLRAMRRVFMGKNGKRVRAKRRTRKEEIQVRGHLLGESLRRLFKTRKRDVMSDLKEGIFQKRRVLSGVDSLMNGRQRLEQQLAYDKTYVCGKVRDIMKKMKNLTSRQNMDAIRNFFKKVKMTQSVRLQFISRGLRICQGLFKMRRKQGIKAMLESIARSERMQTDTASGLGLLASLFHANKKQKVLKAYFQLKTGTLVSQKTRFAGKLLCGALKALFNRRKSRAFRTIQLQGYAKEEKKRQDKKNATTKIVIQFRRSDVLLKTAALKRLREMLEYQKNVFKNGKRVRVFNQMYGDRGPELDESNRKLPVVLRKLLNSRLRQGMEGISTFSKLEFFTRMRGFREEDEVQRRNQLAKNFLEVIGTVVLKRRLKQGNFFMALLKNETSVSKRVYRDQTADDHDEVVQNTIKIANLIKHFRTKQIILLDEYFERWKEATWEYEDDFGYDDFEDEMVNGLPQRNPQFHMSGGVQQMRISPRFMGQNTMDPRVRGHARDLSSPYRIGENGLQPSFDPLDNMYR